MVGPPGGSRGDPRAGPIGEGVPLEVPGGSPLGLLKGLQGAPSGDPPGSVVPSAGKLVIAWMGARIARWALALTVGGLRVPASWTKREGVIETGLSFCTMIGTLTGRVLTGRV
jgi:hypothetical protein